MNLVAGVALLAVMPLMVGALAFHHLAFHLAIHFLAALMLAFVIGMVLTLLVPGMVRRRVLLVVDGGGLRRCERKSGDENVHG